MRMQNLKSLLRSSLIPLLLFCLALLVVSIIHKLYPQLAEEHPHGHVSLYFLPLLPFLYYFLYKPRKEEYDRHRPQPPSTQAHQMLLTVLDGLDAIIYVADMQTHELLFLNRFSRNLFGDGIGKLCWQVLQTNQSGPCSFCSNDKLISEDGKIKGMYAWEFQNTVTGHWYDIRDRAIPWIDGRIVRLEIATDITDKKKTEDEKERMIEELRQALAEVKTLRGIIPICAYCKNIRDDQGYWNKVEEYIGKHSEIDFSHGICPDCAQKHFPELRSKKNATTQVKQDAVPQRQPAPRP